MPAKTTAAPRPSVSSAAKPMRICRAASGWWMSFSIDIGSVIRDRCMAATTSQPA